MALERFSQDFLASHHVTVAFPCPCPPIETLQDDFIAAVEAGEAADVLAGPHDWIGTLAERGLIEPLDLPRARRGAFFPRALDAMTYQGKLYGVPYGADSVALLRNLDLVPNPPTSVEELLTVGRSLCTAGRTERPMAVQVGKGDGFHVYPLFSSLGGRIFGRTARDTWDPDTICRHRFGCGLPTPRRSRGEWREDPAA